MPGLKIFKGTLRPFFMRLVMFSYFPYLMRSIGSKARIAKAMLFSLYTEYLLRRRENHTR